MHRALIENTLHNRTGVNRQARYLQFPGEPKAPFPVQGHEEDPLIV